MSFATDIEDDFDIVDEIETVTVQEIALNGTSSSHAGVSAWKTATQNHLVGTENGGQVVRNSCRWRLKASDLPYAPRKAWRVVSATFGTWEIVTVNINVFGQEYVVETLKV